MAICSAERCQKGASGEPGWETQSSSAADKRFNEEP